MFYCFNFNTVSEGDVGWLPDKEMKPVMKKKKKKTHHQKKKPHLSKHSFEFYKTSLTK